MVTMTFKIVSKNLHQYFPEHFAKMAQALRDKIFDESISKGVREIFLDGLLDAVVVAVKPESTLQQEAANNEM